MSKISISLEFFINLAKAKTVVSRRFENRLGFSGLGFSDFMILVYLSQAPDEKMRRTDLAEKIGLTASGITRLLVPMEKIGLVRREVNAHDGRVSFVAIAAGGKRILEDAMDRAEQLSLELLPESKAKKLQEFSELLVELGKTVVY